MPLIKSSSENAVARNIKTEKQQGSKPQKQAVAIAMSTKDKAKSMPQRGERTATNKATSDARHPGSHDEWEKLGQ